MTHQENQLMWHHKTTFLTQTKTIQWEDSNSAPKTSAAPNFGFAATFNKQRWKQHKRSTGRVQEEAQSKQDQ